MFGGFLGFLAVVALIVAAVRQHHRIEKLEAEVDELRLKLLLGAAAADEAATETPAVSVARVETDEAGPDVEKRVEAAAPKPVVAGPWTNAAQVEASKAAALAEATPKESPAKSADIETAIGTRWAVWVGGIALALGGLFLVRYSIEAGMFGPGVRLTMAALLGLALVAAGEFIRRTGFNVPIRGAAGAYMPGILTAAGAFTLFAAIYAAHGVYGFVGPALAFTLLGLVGVVTIAAALVHGQALAGLGLLGAMLTPALVSSQSPSEWALFGYLAIVLAANTAIASIRDWTLTAAAGFAGTGLWCLLYVNDSGSINLSVVLFINAVVLACCALLWLSRRAGEPGRIDAAAAVAAFFVALVSAQLLIDPELQLSGGAYCGGLLLAAMVLVAVLRMPALPMLHAAGAAALLVSLRTAMQGTFTLRVFGGEFMLDGFPVSPFSAILQPVGAIIALVFLIAGFWQAARFVAASPYRAAAWSGWGAMVPLAALAAHWIAFGNLDRDAMEAVVALALLVALAAAAELIARREVPPLQGGLAVSFALAGAAIAAVLMLHMGLGPLWTTMLIGAAAIVPPLVTRWRSYSVLGWICAALVVAVMARVVIDPTLVGAALLGRTPVFNALLPGYGVPALAFGFAAWQLARTTGGPPRLVMEAAATLFALLALAMLVRHAMNGGVITTGTPSLAEQSLYTLIALGAGGILLALDTRAPSIFLRYASMAAGIVSVALIGLQHFIFLNPLVTNETTGRIPFFNLLFLAYLLPAVAAGALAFYARGRRPRWYSAMLALLASALLFVYATLTVRRLFQGEYIGAWAGMGQLETYSYSALWLTMGVALLVAGVGLKSHIMRIASAVLISVAVAKVFIFDMSALEGVLRALSFIGLGIVLIGIGLFYQKLLTRAARAA